MSQDKLPPDPDSLAKWQQLPQNKPSKDALPPATGGLQWTWGLLIILAALIVIALLLSGRPL